MAIMTETWTRFRYRLATIPEVVALISFLAIFLFFSFATNTFLTPMVFANILTFGSITGIMVIGVAMLMISGEFDLSVGATFAVASYVFALSLIAGVEPFLAALLALLVSALLGLTNGLIVTRTGIPSFIATLGTMLAYRGIVRAIGSGDFATYTGETLAFFSFLNGPITALNQLFMPAPNFRLSTVWFLLIALVFSFILMRTRYGNWTFAAGGSAEAALAQGVNVNRVKITNFVITGLLAGLAGIIQFAHRSSVDPLRGEGMELIAVAACVIGGIRLRGGVGTIFGAMLGILLLQMLEQGLVLMLLPIQIFQAVAGMIIIVAVISNTYLRGGD
jgi:simple sugar transport system permease protein